jgi:two-component system, chemotaxis family, CheB/CheR fusion protein
MHQPKSRERVTASDEWYRWVVQSAAGYAIFSTDLQARILTWDNGAERLFQYRREDVIGEDARFIFTPEDIERHVPESELAEAAEERCAPDERWHVKKDGTIFWASGLMMRVLDDHRRHVGFVKIVRDCTEEKRRGKSL